jgi:bifunctional non-homologous end joining protein LigD
VPRRSAPLPARFDPQLATAVKTAPTGDVWVHELKYDGYRIGCRIDGREVQLLSRNGKDWTDRLPEIRDAAAALGVRRALLDGEVVVLDPDGRTSFQALQNVFAGAGRERLAYLVFDLLHLDGDDVARRPLTERKARLARLVAVAPRGSRVRYADHVEGDGPTFLQAACERRLEGIVSKRRDLPYTAGRGTGWVKTKCMQRQELVIGGFTDPEGMRGGIGALLVGVYGPDGALQFAGKVGTGFSYASARDLRQRLEAIAQPESPFTPRPAGPLGRLAHWVAPKLVAEVAFAEWTEDGKVRHASFRGLRADKSPRAVVRERPIAITEAPPPPPAEKRRAGPKRSAARTRTTARAAGAARSPTRPGGRVGIAGVSLSNPDRVLYPEAGVTKLALARYYEAVADWILPHVAGRPLTLVRCPKGLAGACFFMKHSKVWSPPGLRRVRIQERTKVGEYLVADSVTGLVALAQMDVLEIHTWNSTAAAVERPDRVVIDLDPGPDVPWARVVEAARLVRDALTALGLVSFVKTTGGTGLHVLVPLVRAASWSDCLAFTRALAEALVRRQPDRYTTDFAKRGRERKILIDFLRNSRTNTSVAAYSTRAKPQAPVSVPLAWDELGPRLRSDRFTVANLPRRLAHLPADPWAEYGRVRQRIPRDAVRALADV